ncbi:RNA 2'-phosphotransferase [Fodinibius sediminis]|uniref:Probable RNA 2'-phosphotransferase n=1 Tax=Fodinibius sediminis TaxID=1214077 RepID=A0A521BK56_9BACT|nr:RNA 2'-phosphotransferase [Fodinibius sediminis]SMO47040.1 putative RNA 2'-phosphotransferase [Fodinibius sediminis]
MENEGVRSASKFLSYVLRHHPEAIDLEVDSHGWASIRELIQKASQQGRRLDRSLINKIIDESARQRFNLSADGRFIRAGYGHSIDVDLQLRPRIPPDPLFHGTAKQFLPSILSEGLRAGGRNFVHLSAEKKNARIIGKPHGRPVVLCINTAGMSRSEYPFYQSGSDPGIWLVKSVPVQFLEKKC